MGKEGKEGAKEGAKPAHKGFKKEHNNFNPYNRLELNRFHQEQGQQQHTKYGHELKKKKRDLERMIAYRQKKGEEIEEDKVEALKEMEGEIGGRKREFEKEKRKEFFLSSKYKQVMNIEKRKVAKKLRDIREEDASNLT